MNHEVLEPGDSSQTESEPDTSSAYQEDQEPTTPRSPSGWMEHIESLIKEVREGRSPEGMLASACKEFTNQHSATAADPKLRFGSEWVAKKQGPKEIVGLEESWVPRLAPMEGWTKLDWNVYVVALEIEVRTKHAPEIHLINAWADFSDLLQQQEPGQPIRLTKEWARIIASVTSVWLSSTD